MMDGMMAGMMGMMGLGLLGVLLLLVLAVLGIVALVKWLARDKADARRGNSALDILKERYARGEIGREEFEIKKGELT